MIGIIISLISLVSWLLILLIFISAILSFVMDPYHPIRRRINSIVEPMLAPIRQILPPMGGLDFSPLVLIILIQVLTNIIIRLLLTLR